MIHVNPDKLNHDKPPADKSALWPLHPFRALLCSMPGGGKRQTTLEIIGRHPKPFDTITVVHHAPKTTTEYEVLGDQVKLIGEDDLPDPEFWDRSKRNLLILDEIVITDKKPAYKKKFDRLFNYCSTHQSLSIICQVQDAFTLPVPCRRAMNHWALWRSSDALVTNMLGRRLGVEGLSDIFSDLSLGPHDHVWLDLTGHAPPLRKNILQVITTTDN
jgi:hypothetical protein